MKRFKTIFADPPWKKEAGGGKIQRGADRHYPLMSTEEIIALPVPLLMQDNCHMYLCVTNSTLPDGLRVLNAWGLHYITCITWGKVREGVVQTGIGQYFRGASEHILFARKGKHPFRFLPDGKRAQGRTLILHERLRHSEKPSVLYETVERVSPGPYLELFSRSGRKGWDYWGNEVESTIEMPKPVPIKLKNTQRLMEWQEFKKKMFNDEENEANEKEGKRLARFKGLKLLNGGKK